MKIIVAHKPEWASQYDIVADRLSKLLGETCVKAHHIGSTSIPNIPAKPIIDILMEVNSVEILDKHQSVLTSQSYEARGEYGIAGRRFFKKKPMDGVLAIHLHCYQAQSYEIRRHLAFRDYLRAKPEIAKQYAQMKLDMSDDRGVLIGNYQNAKKPFVDRIALEGMRYFQV